MCDFSLLQGHEVPLPQSLQYCLIGKSSIQEVKNDQDEKFSKEVFSFS